ncbi:hypothetical protein GLOIN_2v1639072 [Rhizophagus clarus]|uniref:Uncharacterized protein n=1 Tax=Rhizophagus clarus TaxID=94130 RepID=A0A8H3L0C6_9GLOM|nr:hypothetical protein GLOIN_2v1639072 [Rhizophagus clarus]
MKSFKSQTKSTTRLSVSSITPIKKSSTMTTTTNTKTKPKTTTKTLSNKDSKVTTTSSKVSTTTATTTTKNFSSSKLSTTAKTSTTSTGKNLPKENRNSRHINSKTSTTSSSTTVKKKTKEKQEKINTISTNLPILENEVKSPIRSEINSVMHEIEKFRTNLHELSRVQEKRNENISSSKNLGLIQDEMMIQAVQNQLSVVRQHITSIMDNYKSDENLLTVIMTYNEEVNIALQEALQEVPKLYQSHLKPPPSPSSSSSLSSQFNDYISKDVN